MDKYKFFVKSKICVMRNINGMKELVFKKFFFFNTVCYVRSS